MLIVKQGVWALSGVLFLREVTKKFEILEGLIEAFCVEKGGTFDYLPEFQYECYKIQGHSWFLHLEQQFLSEGPEEK